MERGLTFSKYVAGDTTPADFSNSGLFPKVITETESVNYSKDERSMN